MEILQARKPKGLYLLFFTELWERFGFYTLQTIMILYMTKGLKLPDTNAYLLYGTFSSMLYLTPVLGRYLADHYLGERRAVMIGSVLLTLGYLLAAIPFQSFFFLGLSVLIVASGLFKPNVSSLVGDMYRQGDPCKRSSFFFLGMNLGSLIPPLITGWMVMNYGWSLVFLVAAMGMSIGLIIFLTGRRKLRSSGAIPPMSLLRNPSQSLMFYVLFYGGIILASTLLFFLFQFPVETDILLAAASISTVAIVIYCLAREKQIPRNKVIACLFLILISIGFWAIYNQTFISLMLYADRNMNKELLGMTINTQFTQFFNPFFVVLLSPVLGRLWTRNSFSTPMKFSIGVALMALGFFVLGIGGAFFSVSGGVSPWWLISSYFLQTMGELLLAPIGLAMITTLSPQHLVGMMMGVWFLTQSAAFAIGGGLATFASVPAGATATESLAIYTGAFMLYGLIAFVLAAACLLLVPYLERLLVPVPDTIRKK